MKVEKIFGNKYCVTVSSEKELEGFDKLDNAALVDGVVPKKKVTHITFGLHEEEEIHKFFARRKKIKSRRGVKIEDLANLMMTNAFA